MLKKNYDSANFYLNEILNKDSISTKTRGFTYLYKGIVNREIGQYDSAEYFFQQSFEIIGIT